MIDTLKEEDQTADHVKNKIQMNEVKCQRDESSKKNPNVFAAKKVGRDERVMAVVKRAIFNETAKMVVKRRTEEAHHGVLHEAGEAEEEVTAEGVATTAVSAEEARIATTSKSREKQCMGYYGCSLRGTRSRND